MQRQTDRNQSTGDLPIVVLPSRDNQLDGKLLDESTDSFGVLLKHDTGLSIGRRVRVVCRRRRMMAAVKDIQQVEGGYCVGLQILT